MKDVPQEVWDDIAYIVTADNLEKLRKATGWKDLPVNVIQELELLVKCYNDMGDHGTVSVSKDTLKALLLLVGKALEDT